MPLLAFASESAVVAAAAAAPEAVLDYAPEQALPAWEPTPDFETVEAAGLEVPGPEGSAGPAAAVESPLPLGSLLACLDINLVLEGSQNCIDRAGNPFGPCNPDSPESLCKVASVGRMMLDDPAAEAHLAAEG